MYMALVVSALLAATAASLGVAFAPDLVASLVCSAPDNANCRPLTLECLVASAGGLGVAWPSILPPYEEHSDPTRNDREYAPEPPPGYEPPPPRSPQDAVNDDQFRQAREDWARRNAHRMPTTTQTGPSAGSTAYDTLVRSIRNKDARR